MAVRVSRATGDRTVPGQEQALMSNVIIIMSTYSGSLGSSSPYVPLSPSRVSLYSHQNESVDVLVTFCFIFSLVCSCTHSDEIWGCKKTNDVYSLFSTSTVGVGDRGKRQYLTIFRNVQQVSWSV